MYILFLQRAVPHAPGGAVPLQGSASTPRVPGAIQGALLFGQCIGLHTRLDPLALSKVQAPCGGGRVVLRLPPSYVRLSVKTVWLIKPQTAPTNIVNLFIIVCMYFETVIMIFTYRYVRTILIFKVYLTLSLNIIRFVGAVSGFIISDYIFCYGFILI